MRRVPPAVLIATAAVCSLISGVSGQQPPQPLGEVAEPLRVIATTVSELRTWDRYITEAANVGRLRLRSATVDPMMPRRVVERYEQFYDGVLIWGADIVRDSERGVPQSIVGLLSPDLTLSVVPLIDQGEAAARAASFVTGDSYVLQSPVLVVLRLDSAEHRLSYTLVLSHESGIDRIFIDAQTGAEILRYSELQRQQAVGTGTGVLGDRKKLSVQASGGAFIAFDRHRPPIIETFDMRGNLARTKLLENGLLPYTMADLASDADNVWSDPAVVDAHAHVSWTYDYFFKRFGRTGIDGRNAPIDIVVNAVSQQGAVSLSAADSRYAVNATWCGSCGPGGRGRLFFGNGIPSGFFVPANGRNYTYFAGALDIAAHELTHAVTQFTSGLIYRNESGALNEAFSDMMGTSAEFFYHPPGTGPGRADYLLGEDIARAVRPGAIDGDRSMANPAAYDDPDHYARRYTGTADDGGVHTNSGIPNNAFYLAIEGGVNRTSGMSVQGVGSASREQIEKVFYRAFTMLPSSANFSMARIATIQAARDLSGQGSAVERAVTQAWDAVGVTNTSSFAPSMPTFTGMVPVEYERVFFYYTVNMPATGRYQAILNWNDASVDLDVMIGRPGCFSYSCMLSRAESPTRRPETVCLSVRAGEQYNVLIQNFGPRAAAYELTQRIDPNPVGPCTASGQTGAAEVSETSANKADSATSVRAERLN